MAVPIFIAEAHTKININLTGIHPLVFIKLATFDKIRINC